MSKEVVLASVEPQNQDLERYIRNSFAKQKVMDTIGAALTRVAPGQVDIALPYRDTLTQQNGFVHGSIIAAIADSACGYAALSLLPEGSDVLTVEYKVNFLAPAQGTRFVARGRVIKSGRRVSVCESVVVAENAGVEAPVAVMLATMIRLGTAVSG